MRPAPSVRSPAPSVRSTILRQITVVHFRILHLYNLYHQSTIFAFPFIPHQLLSSISSALHLRSSAPHVRSSAPHFRSSAPHVRSSAPHVRSSALHVRSSALH
ncbi:hypothetical protein BD626DRAFT_212534 [Schizophyllum amplum]|uniref:Uncharacterized protein n=1 Tax=Schizophyllum amplum TaxID=97359 RepID=A0A550BXU7_9AGAR|nr:hypothetical protein BD626DRAFT_212534 [Auriculariopsis ampla]